MALSCHSAAPKVPFRHPAQTLVNPAFRRIPLPLPPPHAPEVTQLSADEQSSYNPCAAMPAFPDPETYRDILNGLQIGVSVLDLQKKIVFWSDGAEQITGYARIDVLGHSCSENILLHCNQISCEMCTGKCPMATALHDAMPVEAMSFIHHKSGHRTPVHSWAIPLRDQQGSDHRHHPDL